MLFSEILNSVGGDGPFQQRLLLLFLLPVCILYHMTVYNAMFMVFTPEHWCYVPELAHYPAEVQRQLISPYVANKGFDSCSMYDIDYKVVAETMRLPFNETNLISRKKCSNGWSYDKTYFIETAVTKLNLVCDDKDLVSHILTASIFSAVFGRPLSGFISDRFGRKNAFFIGLIVGVFPSIISPLILRDYWSFFVTQFIFGLMPAFTPSYVLTMELSGISMRTRVSGIGHMGSPFALILLSIFGYLTAHWLYIPLISIIGYLPFFFMYNIIPESACWLITRKRYQDSYEVMKRISHINKKEVPSCLLSDLRKVGTSDIDSGYFDVFKSPIMLKRWIIIAIGLIANNMAFSGINFNALNFRDNYFINVLLLGLIEIPGVLIGLWAIETRLGRRWSNCMLMATCGISLCVTIFMPKNMVLITILTLLGKLSISATFMIIYQQMAEIFPTNLRNQSISMANSVRKVFSIAVPYIASLGQNGLWIPLSIFGSFCLLAAILQSFLPETRNEPLPQNIREAEDIGTEMKFFSLSKDSCTKL